MNLYLSPTITVGTATVAVPSSLEKDRVAFDLPSHTVKEPRVVIVSRVPSSGGPKGVTKYTVKSVYGALNADLTAKSRNIQVSLQIDVPDDHSAALTEDAVDAIRGLILNGTIMDTLIEKGQLPYA